MAAGALATLKAAMAGDVTVRPGLLRVRTAPRFDADIADGVGALGAAAGLAVVSIERDAVLAHALDEEIVNLDAVAAKVRGESRGQQS
jgi:hypothetical protein